MIFDSIEHEVVFNKLREGIENREKKINLLDTNIVNNYDPEIYLTEISKNINVMSNKRENHAYRILTSHRKVLGPIIVLGKKIVRKLLKWYIEPITIQQTEFNNAVTPALGRITELVSELMSHNNRLLVKNKELESKINEVESKNSLLEKGFEDLENRISKLNILFDNIETQLNRTLEDVINVTSKNISDDISSKFEPISSKLDHLQKMHDYYKDNILAYSEKIKKLDEIGLFKETRYEFHIKKTYAQAGEDSIIAFILNMLNIPFDQASYIDLGANHARELSNTYFLYQSGARGVLVEANPNLIPELKFYRHEDIILNKCVDVESGKEIKFYVMNGDGLSTPDYNAASNFISSNPNLEIIEETVVSTISYKDIVDKYLGKAPTVLSIDIEGKDLEILKTIDLNSHRPLIIITEMIEYSTKLSYNTKNETIKNWLNANQYDEFAFTGINSLFIDRRYLLERQMLNEHSN